MTVDALTKLSVGDLEDDVGLKKVHARKLHKSVAALVAERAGDGEDLG